jgi:outer membrane immunogenic protein
MYNLSKLAAGTVLAAGAALGTTSAVLADGYAAPRVAYERPADWSGVYFGLSSGWQWSSIDGTFPQFGTHYSVDHNSGIVGGHLGVQHQFGSVVLGVEGNWLTTFAEDPGSSKCPNATFNCTDRLSDIFTVGGRVGWAAGHWMPYVTGGYANARIAYDANTAATLVSYEAASARHSGWYAGGGFEWMVSPGWTTGLEYRHYEFDSNTAAVFCTGCGGGAIDTFHRAEATTDSITARVSWRWGRPDVAPLK